MQGALAERDITLEDYVAGAVKTGWGGRKVELEELEEFSEMLKTRYWGMSLTSGIPMEEYVLQVFEMGEFDHEAYHPVRDFLSGLADTASVGIVPMLELLAGYDFITGEELTEGKVKEKGIEAAAGLVALALIPLTGGTSMGAKEAGKQILIESATGAVGYITYQTGESLDLSPEVTMLITLAGGVLTYKMLNGKFVSIDLADESVDVGVDAVEASVKSNADDVVGLLDDGIEGGAKTRIFREATQQDLDLINDIKTRYNAGKTRNAATAKGTINGESINLECISGKFSHDNYFNKGNFEPPQPGNYHYQGPIPEYTNHTEQKIVEYLRQQFKDNPNVSGEIEIISERIYCDNCKVLVDMFETEFPNIKVTRVEVVK